MCQAWSVSFQQGMHFHLRPNLSVLLMSRRANAPYRDSVEESGKVLIYEGHDAPRRKGDPDPKSIDQPRASSTGKLTQNGLFEKAANDSKEGLKSSEVVAVYEKIHAGIWAFNGFFRLTDCWQERGDARSVFKIPSRTRRRSRYRSCALREPTPHTHDSFGCEARSLAT